MHDAWWVKEIYPIWYHSCTHPVASYTMSMLDSYMTQVWRHLYKFSGTRNAKPRRHIIARMSYDDLHSILIYAGLLASIALRKASMPRAECFTYNMLVGPFLQIIELSNCHGEAFITPNSSSDNLLCNGFSDPPTPDQMFVVSRRVQICV